MAENQEPLIGEIIKLAKEITPDKYSINFNDDSTSNSSIKLKGVDGINTSIESTSTTAQLLLEVDKVNAHARWLSQSLAIGKIEYSWNGQKTRLTDLEELYDFLGESTRLVAQAFNLDVDGNGELTAFGDGLMIIRKMFGPTFSGEELTDKAIAANATRTTDEIHEFIQGGIDSGALDVDQDGQVTAFGDGLMVIRHLFGTTFQEEALTEGAISADSLYWDHPEPWIPVANNIDALM